MIDFPYGEIVSELPEGFMPPDAWPEFGAIATLPPMCQVETVGTHPEGLRWRLWPLCFEEYISDSEPSLADSAEGKLSSNRVIKWKRIANTDIPPGWHATSKYPWRIDGFCMLDKNIDYTSQWSRIARRHLKIWKEAHEYRVEEISLDEFAAAYKKSTVASKIGSIGISILKKRYAAAASHNQTMLWGVRNRHTGAIVAGVAVHYLLAHKSAVHECPFVLQEGQLVHAMVGLIDHWFAESIKREVPLQCMTHFWHPGLPKSWQGFSEFKSHFGLKYIAYPPELIRFTRGKLL
jgi:hypothetical protein